MKALYQIIILLLMGVQSYAQTDTATKAFSYVEQMPEFPGGTKALMSFLSKNITYPEYERDSNIQGKVVLKFIVDIDGSVANIDVIKHVSPGIDSEAIRVVNLLPKFKPGYKQGKPVKVYFNLPISFKLTEPEIVGRNSAEQKLQLDPYYKSAVSLVKQGLYEDAATLLTLSILMFPNDYLGYELLADCDMNLNWDGIACNNYSKAKELGSPNAHNCAHVSVDSLKTIDTLNHIYTFVEQNPQFPGGDAALMKFIQENIQYPQYEKNLDITGNVLLRFVVDVDGSITNVKVIRSLTPGLDNEAVRVIKLLPKFHPGYEHKKAVKVYFNLPVVFRLPAGSSKLMKNSLKEKIQIGEFYRSVNTLIEDKKYEAAINLLSLSLLKFPHEYLSYEFQAACYLKIGKQKDACTSFHRAKELGSPYATTLLDQTCK